MTDVVNAIGGSGKMHGWISLQRSQKGTAADMRHLCPMRQGDGGQLV